MNNPKKNKTPKKKTRFVLALDIETSTIYHKNKADFASDELEKAFWGTDLEDEQDKTKYITELPGENNKTFFGVNFMSYGCISAIPTNKINCDTSDITPFINTNLFRTFKQAYEIIKKYVDEAKQNGEKVVIYIHNINYELSYIIREYNDFFYLLNDNTVIGDSPNNIKCVNAENVEIRDSFILFNSKLATVGDRVGYPKLGDSFDYDKIRYKTDEISENDFIYCKRDCDIILYGLQDLLKTEHDYIKDFDAIPLTSTSITRRYNSYIARQTPYGKAAKGTFEKENKEILKSINDLSADKPIIKEIIKNSFMGGFTHANRKEAGLVQTSVHSIDLTSSYPAAMVYGAYPKGKVNILTSAEKSNIINYINEIKENFSLDKIDKFLNFANRYDHINGFTAYVYLTNVKVKSFNNGINYFPIINALTARNNVNTAFKAATTGCYTLDNGRVISADGALLSVNIVDLILITLLYDYDEIKIIEGVYYRLGSSPSYWKYIIEIYLKSKSFYKQAEKDYNKGLIKSFQSYSNEFGSFTEGDINELQRAKDPLKTINRQKMNAKARLNAQYGINVMRENGKNYHFSTDNKNEKYNLTIKEDVDLTNNTRNFLRGTYITSYSRLALVCGFFGIVLNNGKWLYSDTDSLKFTGDKNKILSTANALIKNARENNRNNKAFKRKDIKFIFDNFKLGLYDYEGTFEKFVTMGNKKYLCFDGKNIHATIAGVTNADTIYNGLLKTYKSFELVCYLAFSLNIIFDKSVMNSTKRLYPYGDITTKIPRFLYYHEQKINSSYEYKNDVLYENLLFHGADIDIKIISCNGKRYFVTDFLQEETPYIIPPRLHKHQQQRI